MKKTESTLRGYLTMLTHRSFAFSLRVNEHRERQNVDMADYFESLGVELEDFPSEAEWDRCLASDVLFTVEVFPESQGHSVMAHATTLERALAHAYERAKKLFPKSRHTGVTR